MLSTISAPAKYRLNERGDVFPHQECGTALTDFSPRVLSISCCFGMNTPAPVSSLNLRLAVPAPSPVDVRRAPHAQRRQCRYARTTSPWSALMHSRPCVPPVEPAFFRTETEPRLPTQTACAPLTQIRASPPPVRSARPRPPPEPRSALPSSFFSEVRPVATLRRPLGISRMECGESPRGGPPPVARLRRRLRFDGRRPAPSDMLRCRSSKRERHVPGVE